MSSFEEGTDYKVVKNSSNYAISYDGNLLCTPVGVTYGIPTESLAKAIAEEWRSEEEKIISAKKEGKAGKGIRVTINGDMPLTQIAATAHDIITKNRESVIDNLVGYVLSELLCHRAETPADLAKRQEEIWQPLLDWCAAKYDALLNVGMGVMPIEQSPETAKALHEAISAKDNFFIAGLSSAVDVTGSLVLGLALSEQARTANEIFQAAELDVNYQSIKWGKDPVTKARHESIKRDLEVCERWFILLRG